MTPRCAGGRCGQHEVITAAVRRSESPPRAGWLFREPSLIPQTTRAHGRFVRDREDGNMKTLITGGVATQDYLAYPRNEAAHLGGTARVRSFLAGILVVPINGNGRIIKDRPAEGSAAFPSPALPVVFDQVSPLRLDRRAIGGGCGSRRVQSKRMSKQRGSPAEPRCPKKIAEATGNSKIESRRPPFGGPLLGGLHLALLGFSSKLSLEIKCCARV